MKLRLAEFSSKLYTSFREVQALIFQDEGKLWWEAWCCPENFFNQLFHAPHSTVRCSLTGLNSCRLFYLKISNSVYVSQRNNNTSEWRYRSDLFLRPWCLGLSHLPGVRELREIFRPVSFTLEFPLSSPTQSLYKKHSFSPHVLWFPLLATAPIYQNAFGILVTLRC